MPEEILYEISDSDKEALYSGNAVIQTKLIVMDEYDVETEYVLSEEDSIKDWTLTDERYVPNEGFIGQFVARTLEGNLHNITDDFNIENRKVMLLMGVAQIGPAYQYLFTEHGYYLTTENGTLITLESLGSVNTTWYSLGTFIITKPEDNEVSDNTVFEAYDNTVLFNKDFNADYINDNWETSFNMTIKNSGYFTALQLAQYVCAQVGIEFANATFTNSDFIIDTNQFTAGDSCRDVMKAIAKLAYGWCRIGWDDKCYVDEPQMLSVLSNDAYSELTNDNYYSLTTQKNTYGPVTRVTVGSSAVDGEDTSTDDDDTLVTEYGLNELVVYDNPLLYNETLRNQAIIGAYNLIGLQYSPLEMKTPGHPWFVGNELITVYDMEGNARKTYPFNRVLEYTGHIKTTITSVAETSSAVSTSYQESLYKTLRDVKITVDKQAGVINLTNSNAKAALDGLSALETKVDVEITDTYSKTQIQEIVTGTGVDGVVVESVKSAAGTFDMNGLTVEQSDAKTVTNINADGMIIRDKTSGADGISLLTVDSTGVVGENVKVKTYLTIGEHARIEDYTDPTYGTGTGVFWIGSD